VRALTWIHRWISVGVCLLFAMWFVSGAVTLFVPFPSLSSAELLARAPLFDPAQIAVAPAAVLEAVPDAQSLRLISRDDRIAYLATHAAGIAVVDARTGESLAPLDADAAARVARHMVDHSVARIDADVHYDQWTVHQGFDAARPFFRIALADAAGTVLYVSARSGEIAQRTTRSQRLWNGVGPVLHWIYFTPVRKHWSVWDQLVWWASLVALLGAIAGVVLGVWRAVQVRRQNGRGFTAFRGWWRWHHLIGLFAGAFLLTWIFSGWLSMDHGRLFSTAAMTDEQSMSLRGRTLQQVASDIPLDSVRSIGRAAELRFGALGGRGFILARGGGADPRVLLAGAAESASALTDAALLAAVATVWPAERIVMQPTSPSHDMHAAAEGVSGEVCEIQLPESSRRIYINALTGEVEAVMDRSRRAYSWFYYALHTWRVPALAEHAAWRKGLMLIALAAGFALSVTGIVLAVRAVNRRA
jgi:uncharacterized iron-regulated membrane protein